MSENKYEIKDYKSAFECFKQRFLEERKSIFDLNNENEILDNSSVKYLIDNFVENGYGGKVSFIEKIRFQLITKPNNLKEKEDNNLKVLQKKALEVLAHIVWLWRLVPYNAKMSSTKASVEEILNLDETNTVKIDDKNPFFSSQIKGIASVGTYYNTNKPFELAYVLKLLEKLIKDMNQAQYIDREAILSLEEFKGEVKISGKYDLTYNENEKKYEEVKSEKNEGVKSASIHHALLHFFNSSNYEAIVSNGHKTSIIKAFEDLSFDKENGDEKIRNIKKTLKEQFPNIEENNHFFYQDEIRELWDPTILPAKNVIYYGAPGTGKTYEITNLVRRKTKNDRKYYKVVQFHPSFSYEDFIDGIKPISTSNNGVQLELVNGIFKEMCRSAYEELERFNNLSDEVKKKEKEPKKFYFIADEINRAELSRVFGELLLCLEDDKRLRFEKNDNDEIKLKGELVKTQNSNLWEKEHAVALENGEYYFGVPENIYFLGTMNDIDRSIDSFDLALRRRFKWVRKDCNYDVISDYLIENDADEYINEYIGDGKEKGAAKGRCILLNEYISNTLNLGKSYELGHTYFMKIKIRNGKISKLAYENLFDQEIGPLVTEYLRAEYPDGKELEKKLKEMKNLFITGSIKNNDTNS
jgi:hypothetical protein